MKNFMDDNFMLHSEFAEKLYHKYAADMPIFDFHSHLVPEQIAEDAKFENLYEIWLAGDHYKWRAMRAFGIEERLITGKAEPYEKFLAYARMISHAIGNPLYHWTHLELQRYFGITTLLSEETAEEIWAESSRILKDGNLGARDFLKLSNVKALCTTDDPVDDLAAHKSCAASGFDVKVLPTFRPDRAMAFDKPEQYRTYLKKLEKAANMSICSFDDLIQAMDKRHEYFHEIGCRVSDHALPSSVYAPATREELSGLFSKGLNNPGSLDPDEIEQLQTAVLTEVAIMNRKRDWTMQIHIGALRNNNSRAFKALGPDSGYDSINDGPIAYKLSRFLDGVEAGQGLPKVILYVLNPGDNYTIASMIGNFQDGQIVGKIQFGSGWWFNDQRDGMEAQMKALANLGLISQFVGMLTDSRSFLSFPRHEYFRRILCNLIGDWVEKGEFPRDEKLLGKMVQNICFNNARDYFGIMI